MGDRTYCSLTITGIIPSAPHAQAICDALIDACPDESDSKIREAFQGKGEIKNHYSFDEVNYGQIDDDLKDALVSAGLSFCWDWGMGGDYIPGCLVYDARDGYLSEENTADDLPFITVDQLDNEERIAAIRKFAARSREVASGSLYIARSAHEQLEIQKKYKTKILEPLDNPA